MTTNGYYHVEAFESLLPDGTSAWTAEHPELPGCVGTGRTTDEAIENLERSREAWTSAAEELGHPVPTPTCDELSITYHYARRSGTHSTSMSADGQPQVIPYELAS